VATDVSFAIDRYRDPELVPTLNDCIGRVRAASRQLLVRTFMANDYAIFLLESWQVHCPFINKYQSSAASFSARGAASWECMVRFRRNHTNVMSSKPRTRGGAGKDFSRDD